MQTQYCPVCGQRYSSPSPSPTDNLSVEYGFHRVIEPKGTVPQAAYRLDNTPRLQTAYELLLDVKLLNLDSTSMRQLQEHYPDPAQRILEIVRDRGKMHNPVTNSGGVLTGYIKAIGERLPCAGKVGDGIIPVASLSTIPLYLRKVNAIRGDQVEVEGEAILFQSLPYTFIPTDFDLETALSAVDISSIVPQIYRAIRSGHSLLVIGTGKAGITAMAAARKAATPLDIIGMDFSEKNLEIAHRLGYADKLFQADARNAEAVLQLISTATGQRLCDVVVNCVNVPNTEASTILAVRPHGLALFFSMATQFDKAALGTDATGKDITMVIGNGVAEGQAEAIFSLLREEPKLKQYFASHGGAREKKHE